MTPPRTADLRLLPSAVTCWAATAVGVGFGVRAAAGFAVVAVVGVAVAVALRARGPAVAGIVIAALLIGTGFAVATAFRVHAVHSHPLAAIAERGGHVTVTAVVGDDPRPVRGPVGDTVMVRAELVSMDTGRDALGVGGAVVVFAPVDGWSGLLPGSRVQFRGRAGQSDRADLTIAVIRATGPPTVSGGTPWHQRAAGYVRDRFADASARALPTDAAGLLPGLVVGDTSNLPEPVDDDFTAAGLAHLTAVSGANVSILLGAVLLLTRAATLGPGTSAAIAGLALLGFVILARPSASVLRAAAMGAVVLLALVVGRRRQAMPALGGAVIALLAWFPELAVSFGFALSVAATAALVLIAPRWARRWQQRGWPRPVAEAVAVAVAAHVVTVPIVAAMSGTVSTVAVLANLLVAPVIAPITVVGALAAVGASVWIPLGEVAALATGPPLWWLLRVAREAAGLPGASIGVPSGAVGFAVLALAVVAAVVAVVVRWLRILAAAVAFGLLLVWVPIRTMAPGWPVPGWVLVACDVGQGDALVLDAGDGTAVVVDAGPTSRAVDECLDRLGVRTIRAVVLTHLHADHIDGLPGVLHGRSVEQVLTGPMQFPAPAYEDVRAQASGAGVPVATVSSGQVLTLGGLTLRVLGPTLPAPRDPGEAEDAANDQSLVMTVDTVAGRILLTGDVEVPGQLDLVRDGAPLAADVLKLPHHGSRTTTPEFLRAVGARLVVVSVGADNTFGHPHPEIVRTLEEMGATVARTDLGGDVAVSRSGGGGVAVTYRRGTIDP